MIDQYFLFILLAPMASVISASSAIYTWRRRSVPGAFTLSLGQMAITGWIISNSFELVSVTDQGTIFSAKISYLFILCASVLLFTFILQYTGHQSWHTSPRFLLFWIIPVITFLLVLTNEIHGLIWADYQVVPINETLQILRVSTYGFWFWIHALYNYGLIIAGTIIIGNLHFRSNKLYRIQSKWIVFGTVAPLIFNIIYVFRLIPMLNKDFSSLAYAFAGMAFTIGTFRHRFLDIMPIARNIMIENMQEGVIVIDNEDRIIDINPSAKHFLIPTSDEIIGFPLKLYLPEADPLLSKRKLESQVIEFSIERNTITKQLEAKLSILKNKKGKELGYLIILQDISERKKLYQEIERLASTDSLTNLNNRRSLFSLGEKEITRAHRYEHALSLLFIDIDQFKKINDIYGHIAGDQVLQQFSLFLQNTLRATDIIGRYGGDEFIAILPETLPAVALATATRLCQAISNNATSTTAGEIRFTLSIGVFGLSKIEDAFNINTLLDNADKALYQAKRSGRNQAAMVDPLNKKL